MSQMYNPERSVIRDPAVRAWREEEYSTEITPEMAAVLTDTLGYIEELVESKCRLVKSGTKNGSRHNVYKQSLVEELGKSAGRAIFTDITVMVDDITDTETHEPPEGRDVLENDSYLVEMVKTDASGEVAQEDDYLIEIEPDGNARLLVRNGSEAIAQALPPDEAVSPVL
jgi:hypothetical protein